jgi:flagellin
VISFGTNSASLNAVRRLNATTDQLGRSYERLSSGLRINRASDDPAGLMVAQKVRSDSILTSQAIRNISDGISLVSIITSALDSQKDILYRMQELAQQSANGAATYSQRVGMQKEYSALLEEFDRIASSAKFNGISLLRNPEPNKINLMIGITGASDSLLEFTAANSHQFAGVLAQRTDWDGNGIINPFDILEEVTYLNRLITPSELAVNQDGSERAHDPLVAYKTAQNGESVTILVQLSRTMGDNGNSVIGEEPTGSRRLLGRARLESGEIADIDIAYNPSDTSFDLTFNFTTAGTTANFSLDISDLSYQSRDPLGVDLGTVTEDAPTRQNAIGFTNVLTVASSLRAAETAKNRLEDVSILHGQYGAIESRLQVAFNLHQQNKVNFDVAYSNIMDTDIASEAANMIRLKILQQASVAVLTQANQQPELMLGLLGVKE